MSSFKALLGIDYRRYRSARYFHVKQVGKIDSIVHIFLTKIF